MSSKVVAEESVEKVEEPQEAFIERIVDLLSKLISKSNVPRDKIRGIGFGIWGPIDRYEGTVRYAVEKGGTISYTSIQRAVEKKFDIPTVVEHDSMLAALGEKWAGIGLEDGVENILFMCSDSGVGLIIKGELYYGATKSAGELNINPPANEEAPEMRCWEGYNYGCCLRSRGIDLGIPSRAKALFGEGKKKKSKILELAGGDPEKITLDIIAEASKENDETAITLLQEAGAYLGTKIAYLVNLFNPEAVVIGRGIEKAGTLLLDEIKKNVKLWGYQESVKVVKIIPASLGDATIATGAGALVIQKIFSKAG
jgi:predicted NBD/HSP70 family sugar kinase